MSKRYVFGGIALIIILPLAALAWWLLSPLLMDQTVDEALPFAAQSFVPPGMTKAEVQDVMAGMAKLTSPVDEPMPDMMMTSAADSSGGQTTTAAPGKAVDGVMPGKTTGDQDSSGGQSTTAASESPESAAAGSGATATSGNSGKALVLSKGTFQDADRFHQGSGDATIYRAPDGSYLLRLEDFKVTNGPDLHVILSTHPSPESRDDVHRPGYQDLGSLKGNVGNQNYAILADVDVSALASVVIYCAPFHVVFAIAPLKRSG